MSRAAFRHDRLDKERDAGLTANELWERSMSPLTFAEWRPPMWFKWGDPTAEDATAALFALLRAQLRALSATFMAERRELAIAWQNAWDDDPEDGAPEPCEGCARPAVTSDCEGVPLCQACSDSLDLEEPDGEEETSLCDD